MGRIKHSILFLGIIIIVIQISCTDKVFTFDVDCNECYSEKPDSVDLIIQWTKNSNFQEIPILLYKGPIAKGEFIDTFFLFGDPAYVWVKAEEEYSIKAIYETNERTVMVVDGTKQKIKKVSDYCDYDCWVIVDEELDVKLRY